MGVIKKKTAVRGTEGGTKYICDVCSADITSTVRISCVNCPDYDLCVPCFTEGKASRDHDPSKHAFQVIEQHSIPIYQPDWGADEELLILEGAETYGLGSWADISDHVGGCRKRDEVRDHYIDTYVYSDNFPLPERAALDDRELLDTIPREVFQANKKRRIEERKEEAANAAPEPPKQKPTASIPSCHEVQGYMPGRLEFETEYFNEAEEAVQHMTFEPGDGINPLTGELEPEMELKVTVMDIYNSRLTARVDRKKVIFEHRLLEYRKHQLTEKKRSKDEKELLAKSKPFARMMTHDNFMEFSKGVDYEYNLRTAITQLQEWRNGRITTLKAGNAMENEKTNRLAKPPPANPYDRLSSSRGAGKPTAASEPNASLQALMGPGLTSRFKNGHPTPPGSTSPERAANEQLNGQVNGQINGQTNSAGMPIFAKQKFVVQPLPNQGSLKLKIDTTPDMHLLTPEEQEICSTLRIMPKPYIVIKDAVIRESIRQGGSLKKKTMKELCKIDANKSNRLFDFFVHCDWIGKG